jgi:hypothetical protein
MCEDQGMAITSWASLGGGQLTTKEQREKLKNDPDAGHGYYETTENDIKICEVLEDMASRKNATLQDIVSHSRLPSHVQRLTCIGFGVPLPSVDIRLPNCWCTNRRARQDDAECSEHSALGRRDRRDTDCCALQSSLPEQLPFRRQELQLKIDGGRSDQLPDVDLDQCTSKAAAICREIIGLMLEYP